MFEDVFAQGIHPGGNLNCSIMGALIAYALPLLWIRALKPMLAIIMSIFVGFITVSSSTSSLHDK